MWWLLFLLCSSVIASDSIAALTDGVPEIPDVAKLEQQQREAVSLADVLRQEERNIGWCYKEEAARLEPGVEAVVVVLIAVDDRGKATVMSRDEMLSTVGSEKSDACLSRYLGRYTMGREEINKLIIKKTLTIPREVKN